ncbi:hypothetical protein [Bacillus sp. FJAT-44742]|nr:hypothetical protein [Bacillus sp. FJAT-44742]
MKAERHFKENGDTFEKVFERLIETKADDFVQELSRKQATSAHMDRGN